MSFTETHVTYRWKIEQKPEGGFVARSDDSAETIEGATREEVEAKLKQKLASLIGPEIAKINLREPTLRWDTHIDKKFTITRTSSLDPAGSGSLLSATWKILVVIGIVLLFLVLARR